MSNFLHCTFFCMLVPIVVPLFTAQVLFYYWAVKIRLLKFCKFPTLVRRWLLGIVFSNLMVSPLFFAAGYLITEYAYKSKVAEIDGHIPVGIYVLFAWVVLFAVVALFADKWLENKKFFGWVDYKDEFTSL